MIRDRAGRLSFSPSGAEPDIRVGSAEAAVRWGEMGIWSAPPDSATIVIGRPAPRKDAGHPNRKERKGGIGRNGNAELGKRKGKRRGTEGRRRVRVGGAGKCVRSAE